MAHFKGGKVGGMAGGRQRAREKERERERERERDVWPAVSRGFSGIHFASPLNRSHY